jgi:hypothetical protein
VRTWEYVLERAGEVCGNCAARQAVGTPVLVIVLDGISAMNPKRRRIRCRACADEPIDQAQLAQFFPPVTAAPKEPEPGS